jgi:hypothetical protein
MKRPLIPLECTYIATATYSSSLDRDKFGCRRVECGAKPKPGKRLPGFKLIGIVYLKRLYEDLL